MNKRLRKKYRVGEFRELCFEVTFEYKGDVASDACGAFLDTFLTECIEANGMDCGGCVTEEGCNFVVTAVDPKTTAESHRAIVKAWLEGREDVSIKTFGELEDAWYAAN